jgi:AcrR family transcriptional regulator
MSPRETTFTRETVLQAGVAVVREAGWTGLTARKIARRLKASVAPVYSAFGSMPELERAILREARCRLSDRTIQSYSEVPFLNIGVGIVTFARDEAHLFSALFHTRHSYSDILKEFDASILDRMKQDPMLRLLPDESLRRLLDNIWMYTLGLATSIVYGQAEDVSTEHIIRSLRNAGNMMIFAEVAGIADCEAPENDRQWTRILKEKKIRLPQPEAAAVDSRRRKDKR